MKVCMKKQTQKRWAWLLALVMCLSVIMPTSLMSARADGSSTVVKYEHNFTIQGVTSDDFFTIAGSAGKKKGTATYDGVTYTDPLKFDSKASVKFTAPEAGKLTLVFGTEVESAAGKNVKINGTKTKVGDDGVLTVDISAGDYTITKGDTMNLFYIVYSYTKQGSTEETTKPTEETTKATEAETKTTEAQTKATEATTKETEAATKPSETKPSETKPDTGDTTVEQVSLIQSTGWLESAYVEWNEAKNAVSYNVYVKKADAADTSYEKLDNELVRK
jgi:pectate lyase